MAGPEGDATLEFLQNPLGFLERNTGTYGGVVGLQLGGELVALVTDPAVAKFVLIDGAFIFVKVWDPSVKAGDECTSYPTSHIAYDFVGVGRDKVQQQQPRKLAPHAWCLST